ncbi:Triphosphate tunnel metalloenzyme 3 [Camellia lanceoleosa]|nr:Triphosphate tunnel metalloenzyme 3 [Camellia lanceoleosa]
MLLLSVTKITTTTRPLPYIIHTFANHTSNSISQPQPPPPPPPLLRRLLHHSNHPENPSTKTLKPPQTQKSPSMEVEVKLRLPDSTSHQKLSSLLSPFHTKTLIQENIFFDGANSELSSNLAVLRLRFYGGAVDSHSVVSLKAKPVISAGISRVEEDEEPIDSFIARACVAEPWRLLSIDSSRVLKRVREEFGVGDKGLVCLGGFRNVRQVFDWNGLKLELDETHFDFGTCYEIECESSDPERVKKLIEDFLNGNGISYSYSEVSKFAIFRSGKLPK